MKKTVAVFVILLSFYDLSADSKKALKMLETGEFNKLLEYLGKAMEKDSLNSGAEFVYSLLYLDETFYNFNADSSYQHINKALEFWPFVEEREKEKLVKIGLGDSAMTQHKLKVERYAYSKAVDQNKVSNFEYYLEHYPESHLEDSAIYFRDALAFNDAIEENTYQSMDAFIKKYPDAKQVPEAQQIYQRLLFESTTSDQSLSSYEKYLQMNPEASFSEEAIFKIYKLSTIHNLPEEYLAFINKYPNSRLVTRAVTASYHPFKERNPGQSFNDFMREQRIDDSLKNEIAISNQFLVPTFENEKFGFMTYMGTESIRPRYDKIDETYICGNITRDVLSIIKDGVKQLVSPNGSLIFEGDFSEYEDLGYGMLKIRYFGLCGILYKDGTLLLDYKFEDVSQVEGSYLLFKQFGKWGMQSISGQPILEAEYDSIYSENGFLFVEKDGLLRYFTNKQIDDSLEGGELTFSVFFEDYEVHAEDRIQLFNRDKEALFDNEMNALIEFDVQQLYRLNEGWAIQSSPEVNILNNELNKVIDLPLTDLSMFQQKVAVKAECGWLIVKNGLVVNTNECYEQIKFLSKQITILTNESNHTAMFGNKSVTLENVTEYKLLSSTSSDEETPVEYLLTKLGSGKTIIYNRSGEAIIETSSIEFSTLGNEYLLASSKGKKGLYYKDGSLVLKVKYSAIGNYKNGYVSTLINGYFGLFNHEKEVFLNASFKRPVKHFNEQYFIGNKDGKLGLVDRSGKVVGQYEYDDINYWNDTLALVKKDRFWGTFDLKNKEMAMQEILAIEWVKEADEKIAIFDILGNKGAFSNTSGRLINPTFSDLINIGTADEPIFYATKFISEADFYVVIYYNKEGKILRKQVFSADEYKTITCG